MSASIDSQKRVLLAGNSVDKLSSENSQRESRLAAVTKPLVRNAAIEPWITCFNALNEQMIQLRAQRNALSLGNNRPHRRRNGTKPLPREWYQEPYQERARKCPPFHLEPRKRDRPFVNAVNDDCLASRRTLYLEGYTRTSYLVDTGANISVYPRNKIHGPANKSDYELFATNGTRIATYGILVMIT